MNVKITTLIENSVDNNCELIPEHGLSFFIESKEANILFDTGQTGKFIKNAKKMDINLSNTNYVVLSHAHYDHTGGLRKFVNTYGNEFDLYISTYFFDEKYSYEDNKYIYKSNNFDKEYLNRNNIKTNIVEDSLTQITPNIYLVTNFTRRMKFEKMNKKFNIKKEGEYILDKFNDEVAVVIDSKKGLVVLVGCSHPGIVNILNTIHKRLNKNIYGVLGGTHLIEGDNERIEKTIRFLKKMDIKLIGTSHCTGQYAMNKIKKEFGTRFFNNHTGRCVKIDM